MLKSWLERLRAPLRGSVGPFKRPRRFRVQIEMTHTGTRVYESYVRGADQALETPPEGRPYLVYHHWRFDWRGQRYEVSQKDWPRRFTFQPGQGFAAWIDPRDLSEVWIVDGAHRCAPWSPEEEEEEEEEEAAEGPLLAVDVHYAEDGRAVAVGVLFDDWHQEAPSGTLKAVIAQTEDYAPGAFYKRELPCILAVIQQMETPPSAVLIDGYVTLGAAGEDGLGMHLFRALDARVAVIGVAKTWFRGTPEDAALLRGQSTRPLYVTAAGMAQADAKRCVRALHGPHRVPSMLALADRLARAGLAELTAADCLLSRAD